MNSEKKIADVLAFAWLECEIHALIISFQLYYWEKIMNCNLVAVDLKQCRV